MHRKNIFHENQVVKCDVTARQTPHVFFLTHLVEGKLLESEHSLTYTQPKERKSINQSINGGTEISLMSHL